ncbi:MAG: HEAT repeat domain-containing protein [Planctomycetes bacterium]|nr:HEAT repeat domain-containing protein [Planctomycetota bacterium]
MAAWRTWALVAILAAAAATTGAPARAGGDPVLEGEAKKKHDDEVKRLLAELRGEKNKVLVAGHIERIGATGGRAGRDALIAFATGNKNQEYVGKAFTALAKIGGATVIDFLSGKEGVRSGDTLVQIEAAGALASTKDPTAAKALLDVATNPSTKSEVLGAVCKAAAQVAPKDEKVVETLLDLTKAVKDMTRQYAADAIGWLASDAAIARLAEMLETERNGGVRTGACRGLGNTMRADAIPYLEKAIAQDKALQVKDAASTAITKIRGGAK